MKFHLGPSLGTGSISCTYSFPFDMVPLLKACSSDGVNDGVHHADLLKTSSESSQVLCQPVHIFPAVQLLAADILPHTRAREENQEVSSPLPFP